MKIVKNISNIKYESNHYVVTTNSATMKIWFVTDEIVRIRVSFDSDWTEESYTLVTTAWEDRLDSVLQEERTRIEVAETSFCDEIDSATITSEALNVVINKSTGQINIYNIEGQLIHSDIVDLAYRKDSNNRRYHTQEIFEGDAFYGFGEKTGAINKFHQRMTMSQNDTMGYDPINADSLYKHIPFYIRANSKEGFANGYFYHNTNECTFDMGKAHSNYWKPHSTYCVDDGDIDLFFMAGPTIEDVVKQYTFLTGRSCMLPKGALGYLGSSMYYSELSENCDDAILKFIDTAAKEDIPIDGFQLSSGYTSQDTSDGEKRCVFTWNKARFKDPASFFEEARKRGVTVSPNVKPGILLAHPEIDKFVTKDILVKPSHDDTPTGVHKSNYATGTWWGGEGAFADYTNPTCRSEWKKMLKENVLDYGTTSIWNDNCEYDSIVDKDAVIDFDGKESTIGAKRSIMANLMCMITKEAINENDENTRPFIVCRAGHSGIQRYAQSWAGDNRTCWEALKYNVATVLGMSMCGVSNYGCDIGGFYGNAPEPELFVRWVQNGIFMPRFSIHSVNTDNTVTEPWMYPKYTSYIRDAINLRYKLFPYYYSLMQQSNELGSMILKPLFAAFPNDEKCVNEGENFLVGDSLLVASVLDKGAKTKEIYFPLGSSFYELDSRKCHIGGSTIEVEVDMSSIPLFLTSGAILPLANNKIMNITKEHVSSLKLICIADKASDFTYYEDDGITLDYQKGIYHKMHIDMKSGTETVLKFTHEGKYQSTLTEIDLEVTSPNNSPLKVELDNKELEHFLYLKDFQESEYGWYYDIERKTTLIHHPYIIDDYKLVISYENFDMLGM